MRANSVGVIVIAALVLALLAAYGALFTVYQTKQALLVRLGEHAVRRAGGKIGSDETGVVAIGLCRHFDDRREAIGELGLAH